MSNHDDLLAADLARREAMITADVAALAGLLHRDLVWTHSSGRTDDKAAVLEAIESHSVEYLSLNTEGVSILQLDDIFICNGTLHGKVRKDGVERDLRNKFLSVWTRQDSSFAMLAWQSTGF